MKPSAPEPEAQDFYLRHYRRNLILVAVISGLCGLATGVFAVAPLRNPLATATLAPPVLRTAMPLAPQAVATQATQLEATPTTSRQTTIEVATPEDAALLNINMATQAQLEALPGIGETRAKDIIVYREANGDFTSIEDITQVSGIGEGTLEKIAPYITVGQIQD